MCGIVAYTGDQPAKGILIEGLKRLEYRGYDSSGIFIANGSPYLARAVGKVAELERQVWDSAPDGVAGIAHTRWATHGKPSVVKCSPPRGLRRQALSWFTMALLKITCC